MFAFLKFCFLCTLAIASGVFAVSVPVAGRTTAEHVRSLVHRASGPAAEAPKPAPPARKVAAGAPRRDKPPADDHTADERAALDELIGRKVGK